jgi:hypothetical protein
MLAEYREETKRMTSITPPSAAMQNLRPMNIGDLLDRTIRIFRANFGRFFLIGAIVGIPMLALQLIGFVPYLTAMTDFQQLAQNGGLSDPDNPFAVFQPLAGPFALLMVVSIIAGLLSSLAYVAQVRLAGKAIDGGTLSLGEAYRGSISGWLKMIGVGLLLYLVLIPTMLLAIIPCVGIIAVIAIVAAGGVRLGFAPQAIALEGAGVIDSLKRSAALTRGHFWRLLGYLIVISLLVYAVISIPALIVQLGATFALAQWPIAGALVSTVVSTLLSLAIQPVILIAQTLLYVDQRNRVEGLDIQKDISNIEQTVAQ